MLSDTQELERWSKWIEGRREMIPPSVAATVHNFLEVAAQYLLFSVTDCDGDEKRAAIERTERAFNALLEISGGFAGAMAFAEPSIAATAARRHQIRLLCGIVVEALAELPEEKMAAMTQEHAAGVRTRYEATQRAQAERDRQERLEEERKFHAWADSIPPTTAIDMAHAELVQVHSDDDGNIVVSPPGALSHKIRRLLQHHKPKVVEHLKNLQTAVDRI